MHSSKITESLSNLVRALSWLIKGVDILRYKFPNEQGKPSVSIGHYIAVLSVLDLVADLALVTSDDILGRKLQDIKLLNK